MARLEGLGGIACRGYSLEEAKSIQRRVDTKKCIALPSQPVKSGCWGR
jgi:hypothetical protein